MTENAIPTVLQEAITRYNTWNLDQLTSQQLRDEIKTPLYHYTNHTGLEGIIRSQTIWFTDYRHLNDPSELTHGIEMAQTVISSMAADADGRARLFLKTLGDMFSLANFRNTLGFFVASFSRDGNDLGQWRSYGDNGRGYALALAPQLFRMVEMRPEDTARPLDFVGPVYYANDEISARHHAAIERATSIFLDAANANIELMRDRAIGFPFIKKLAIEVIASPLIWNCLTSKHLAYRHEREVRVAILGATPRLAPFVTTRLRGSEVIPYIAHPMEIRVAGAIFEIVVGPAAPADSEQNLRTMLDSLGVGSAVPIRPSDIPYRVT